MYAKPTTAKTYFRNPLRPLYSLRPLREIFRLLKFKTKK